MRVLRSRFLTSALIITCLAATFCVALFPGQTQKSWAALPSIEPGVLVNSTAAAHQTPKITAAVWKNDQVPLAQLNPFQGREPIVVNPNRAYHSVLSLPGSAFHPINYPANTLVDQLAHSSNGIVRLPPGDYSIPVRLY